MPKAKRLELVEQTMRDRGWSMDVLRDLMTATGAAQRTLYRDRDEAIARLRDEEVGTRETRRTAFLLNLRRDIWEARQAEKWSPVASMRRIERDILGLDVPPPEPDTDDQPAAPEGDDLAAAQAHLLELRSMLTEARSRGSMVAAVRLAEEIRTTLADIREIERAREAAKTQDADDATLLADVAAAADTLPDTLVEQLITALQARKQ